jgi:predicted amidohydrolase
MTVVVCQQVAPRIGDLAFNGDLSTRSIVEAVAAGAEVILLPELVTSGFAFTSSEEAGAAAIGDDDPLFDSWATAAAGRAVVVGGFCESGEGGKLYNSAVLIDTDGRRHVHRKLQLWHEEKRFFTPGTGPPRVFETAVGKIAVLVCYDAEFPELTRTVSLDGAELLAVPTNWPLVERPPGERPPEALIAQATARINRICIACCDRTGTERGQEWTAGTCIVDADGWIVAEQSEAGMARADLDLAASRDKRVAGAADAFADRRPEIYGRVVQPPG